MTNTTVPAIYPSMAQCVADIGLMGISKDGQNSFQKFNYRSIDATLAAFNTVFAKNHIFTSQRTLNVEKQVVGQDAKGVNVWSISFDLEVTFYSGIDGSTLPCPSVISGVNDGKDSSKLTGQLTSYLLKELFFKQFVVPTSGADDIDSRDGDGIPLSVRDDLKANQAGVKWQSPPKDPAQILKWAAKMTGFSDENTQRLLDSTKPDANGKKFNPFCESVKEIWSKN